MGDIQWGEDVREDEARDAAFPLTGAGTWVGKLAYLTAEPDDHTRGQKGHYPSCIG